ncbi:type II toxin-antitoxin system VapB family antitoxin [Cognataquiflexum rubidum]|uniref:type II toxin-antitoxin system VapB family antitoxin n=1 Tax=Cognataquiflexum rubidum TaxID=2922273 RepID=UPI001F13F19C|nr:type II toxin-antitoxin system VapB family antitoxin [Cognataquiflexum rubidum]MCH6234690.1 type II toxin-antitoxin system VapB family antitoxin [Cognataquiflexum rubidum]
MKITVNLPKELIEEAKIISGNEDLNDLIIQSLNEKIKSHKRKALLSFEGKVDLNIFLDDLRKRNR